MSDTDQGLATAVALIAERTKAGTEARASAQLSLLPTQAAIEDAKAPDSEAARSGPGRPAGSRNKSTDEWVDFISKRYRSPLLFLAEAYSRPVEQLAQELGCKRQEAFAVQIRAAEALAPYMHQKQPQAIALEGEGGMVALVIHQAAPGTVAPAQGGGGARVIDMLPLPAADTTEEKQ